MTANRSAKSPAGAKKATAKRSAGPSAPKLSADDKARYKKLLAAMSRAREGESFAFDRYWEAIDEILFRELWRADKDVLDVGDWITTHTGESVAVAYKNCRVARHSSADDIARYRPSKIEAALRFIETRDDQALPRTAKVNLQALLVPVVENKKSVMRSLDDVTVEQVEEATKALLPAERRHAPSPSEKRLTQAFAKRKALLGASAAVRDGMLSVKNVPLTSVQALIEALRELEH